MKKKRFYKNVKRNQTWTEEEQGRKIDFADKYIYSDTYSDKYDYLRPKETKKRYFNKHRVQKFFKRLAIAAVSFAIICTGYTFMAVYMERHAMPVRQSEESPALEAPLNEIALDLNSEYTSGVSFDGGVMLDAVITELGAGGFNSVTIDIKRKEGTIGYRSALANVDTFGAVAFPANDLKGSVKMLKNEDILAVGIVYCYLDNLVPSVQGDAALKQANGALYRDSRDNTYLNPDSEITYNYIKGVIQESYEMGVTVFVLDGTELPGDIAEGYGGGFDSLSSRLYKDLGFNDIKFVRPVYVTLENTFTPEDIEEYEKTKDKRSDDDEGKEKGAYERAMDEIAEKLSNELKANEIYFINTQSDKNLINEKLEEQGVLSYILAG